MASRIDPTMTAAGTPIVTGPADAVDVAAFLTRDASATWYSFPAGKDFS